MFYYQMTPEQFLELMKNPVAFIGIIILATWSLIWKGFALWQASRNYQRAWFIVLLAVNTVGILEILYLFYFSKKKDKQLPMNPV